MLALSSQQAEATELQLDFIASYDRLQEAVTQISLVAYSWYRHHRLYFTAPPECLERRSKFRSGAGLIAILRIRASVLMQGQTTSLFTN